MKSFEAVIWKGGREDGKQAGRMAVASREEGRQDGRVVGGREEAGRDEAGRMAGWRAGKKPGREADSQQ